MIAMKSKAVRALTVESPAKVEANDSQKNQEINKIKFKKIKNKNTTSRPVVDKSICPAISDAQSGGQ